MIEYTLEPENISHNGKPELIIYANGQVYMLKEPCRFEVTNGYLGNLDTMIFEMETTGRK